MTRAIPSSAVVERLSPTSFEVMSQCRLRFAFGQQRAGSFGGTPATRLGSICHAVLDAAVKHGSLLSEKWRADIEGLWQQEVTAEEERAREVGVAEPARAWPGYQLKRARLLRVADHLRAFLLGLPPGAEALTEQPLVAEEGRLYGRADLVVRGGGVHRIIDYKSGSVTDDEGLPREAYVRQLQIYALLEHAVSGDWPETAHLFPLQGAPVEIDVDPAQCLRLGERALALLAAYNAAAPGPQPAAPARDTCRWCPQASHCDAFWDAVDESWSPDVQAGGGTVTKVFSTPIGGVTVELEVAKGSVALGQTAIKQIDPLTHKDTALLTEGAAAFAVGLVPDERGAGYWLGPAGRLSVDGR